LQFSPYSPNRLPSTSTWTARRRNVSMKNCPRTQWLSVCDTPRFVCGGSYSRIHQAPTRPKHMIRRPTPSRRPPTSPFRLPWMKHLTTTTGSSVRPLHLVTIPPNSLSRPPTVVCTVCASPLQDLAPLPSVDGSQGDGLIWEESSCLWTWQSEQLARSKATTRAR
jgi:hypothetical protein